MNEKLYIELCTTFHNRLSAATQAVQTFSVTERIKIKKMNEEIKIKKYALWIAIIGLLTVIVTQWDVLFSKKTETQQQPIQPTISINNEVNNTNNQNQMNASPNKQAARADKIKKNSSPEPTIEENHEKIEKGSLQKYTSRVMSEGTAGVANVEIYCPNCLIKRVKTDANGYFTLEGYFEKSDAFWQSGLTISKDEKRIIKTIYWREKSPELINF